METIIFSSVVSDEKYGIIAGEERNIC